MIRQKLVVLLEPELCLECRFSELALVKGERAIRCKRKDCDNWGETIEPVVAPKDVESKNA